MTEILIGSLFVIVLVLLLTLGLLIARAQLVPEELLTVTVNETTPIEAKRGDRLLQVLHGAGISLPASCGGKGTCGLCRVQVTGQGIGVAQATERGIISSAELRANKRLACQVAIRGPVTVTLPGDVLEAEGMNCRVMSNSMLAPLIRELVLQLPEGNNFQFRAGSFMQLSAPPYSLEFADIDLPDAFAEEWQIAGWTDLSAGSPQAVTRAYSVASRPEDTAAGHAVFNIRLAVPPAGQEISTPPGIVSSYLFSLRPGDTIGATGPFGDFHVHPTERDVVFIGGGVGMAPLRAMIHEQISLETPRRMWFFYGARSLADLLYNDEFERLADENENFSWTPALSEPAPGDRWTGETGFIHEIVLKQLSGHSAPEDYEYYLCGPPVMISAVLTMLNRLGVERHMIYNDDFGV